MNRALARAVTAPPICAADLEATGLHARSTDRPSTLELHTVSVGGPLNTAYRTIIARGWNRIDLRPSYLRRQQNKRTQPDCKLATRSSDHVESPLAYWHSIRPAESISPVEDFPLGCLGDGQAREKCSAAYGPWRSLWNV